MVQSAEDEDIEWIQRELKTLLNEAQSLDDLGSVMIERLASMYDERIEGQRVCAQAAAKKKESWFNRKICSPQIGVADAVTSTFIDSLESDGVISKLQKKVITRYRCVRFSENGNALAVLPPSISYLRAKFVLTLLATLALFAIGVAWQACASTLAGFTASWVSAYVFGLAARIAYDSAWGREQIARQLKARHCWLVLVNDR